MRAIDRLTTEHSGIPSIDLMQNAAGACFLEIQKLYSQNLAELKVLVLCGPGNNGGDGAALAVQLAEAKADTDVMLFANLDSSKGDARLNFERVREISGANSSLSFVECQNEIQWETFARSNKSYDLIVDGLFGTGLSRPLNGLFARVVDHLEKLKTESGDANGPPLILSIDIPSGLNADLANPIGPAVGADMTVTFTAPKIANVLAPASHLNGNLRVAAIGSPEDLVSEQKSNLFLIESKDVQAWLYKTRYTPESYKNSHGRVLIIAGSRGYTGAAVLCGNAAMRSGAGLVTIATPASAQVVVASTVMPEVMTTSLAETDLGAVSDAAIQPAKQFASRASVVAIGPGLSSSDERTRHFVYSVVKDRTTPIVVDADGLNCLAPWPADLRGSLRAPNVLTPHTGEMRRLLALADDAKLDDRVAVAHNFAKAHDLIVVLKGSRTLIATPDAVFINPTGNAGLGTAGSGDTLTGIIAGLIAQSVATFREKADIIQAVIGAVYIGGLAGDLAAQKLGMRGMVASDITSNLSQAFCVLDSEGEAPSGKLTNYRKQL